MLKLMLRFRNKRLRPRSWHYRQSDNSSVSPSDVVSMESLRKVLLEKRGIAWVALCGEAGVTNVHGPGARRGKIT